jgi:hypothetical protein
MSGLNNFKHSIEARQRRIREMRFNFEPDEKIKAFKEVTLGELKKEYISEVKRIQDLERARQQGIIDSYTKAMEPLPERHQRLAITQSRLRAMSLNQLRKEAQHHRDLPAIIQDSATVYAIAAEMRNRGTEESNKEADILAGWAEANRIDEPWTHDCIYQDIDRRIEKLDVLAAQADAGKMFVLTDKVDGIKHADIVMIETLDKVNP